jgi:hypothetical protein
MRLVSGLLALTLSLGAQAAPPSQESVEALMSVTLPESSLDSVFKAMDQLMQQMMQRRLKGKTLTAEQQRTVEAIAARISALMRDELSLQKLKPRYVQIYRETFDQEEIDGMLAYYTSPTGQAEIRKMPTVMVKSLVLSQSVIEAARPKIEAAVKEALLEAKLPAGS